MDPSSAVPELAGRPVIGTGRSRIGAVRHVYGPLPAGRAGLCVTVETPSGCSAVPLARASLEGCVVVVPYSDEVVAAAPPVEDGCAELSGADVDRLYAYYAVPGAVAGQLALHRLDGVSCGASPAP